ncbi:cytochrome P450 9e2-like [Cylas formicarius]|uniref:cytochrome P450 9e2-like n=1 Tax=Cylas formicarius TaxID=197179 RepID=UPI0029584FAF|nr:cytochrome P450 9e2-like [Cylas formicarius]XP_060530968.1 cytochrome P450 9e2-like [Cylas formicarius]XP_060530969.1 cytochrome P450 9e2-like [Cylas formicarius]
MITIILAGIVLSILFWYLLIKPLHYWRDLGVKQTNPWVFLGDNWVTVFRRKSFDEMIVWLYNMYPNERYSGMYQGYVPTLLIRDPELIKQVTVKDFDHFTDHRPFVDAKSDPLWGKNLFALKGQNWKDMRATLSASFTSSKIKFMFHLIGDTCENLVQFFDTKKEDLIELEVKEIFTRLTNDVIASAAFGIKVDSLAEPHNEFYHMGKALTNFSGIKMMLKFMGFFIAPKLLNMFKITFFDAKVSKFFTQVISETIKAREEGGIVRPDMINLLLEARKGLKHEISANVDTGFATVQEFDLGTTAKPRLDLTDQDITSQAVIFFFAGFDAVSTAMCFALHELACNHDIQQKLREEIISTASEYPRITYDGLLKMKYLDMVVAEILRKWSPGVATDRVCTKPYTIEPVNPGEKALHLPIGTTLFIPMFAIHRDPTYYPNPEKFDPERFSDENKDNIKPYTFIPFGSGPRNCIGSRFAILEVKAMLYHLLFKYEVVPTAKTQIPLKITKKSLNFTAENGFWFGIKRIRNGSVTI